MAAAEAPLRRLPGSKIIGAAGEGAIPGVQEPGGGLALALSNPLMLSLCRFIYTDRSADELADRYRFAQRAAIDDHLLGRFVHAAYAATSSLVDSGKTVSLKGSKVF